MFVDEITIAAKAGDGGDGVVRFHREKFKPKGGPSGGNGGKGGDVYVRGVNDLNRLASYTGAKTFRAKNGEPGRSNSQYGKGSTDLCIDIPVGSKVTDVERGRSVEIQSEGQVEKILRGGHGGLGNKYFKGSTNQTPQQSTRGQIGEAGTFKIELALVVDAGLIGFPNAGKSTLLNLLTNAKSVIGHYSFTTVEPHLGTLGASVVADIPGLIEGASEGKGLGHKFLRHITRTKLLLHVISLENVSVENAYYTIRNELSNYEESLLDREEWIVLSKKDIAKQAHIAVSVKVFDKINKRVFVVSENEEQTIDILRTALVSELQKTK